MTNTHRILVAGLLLGASALAQTSHPKQTFIKGSEHPEQIPDEAAAAAVFSVHSQGLENSTKHQLKIGLSESDQAIYSASLETYRRAHLAKVRVSAPTLLKNLQQQLSPEGYQKLVAFIRSEKRFMQFANSNGGEVQ